MAVDTILRQREVAGRPIRVGMIGAGATGRAIALQLGTPAQGIRLVAIANRTLAHGSARFVKQISTNGAAYRRFGMPNGQSPAARRF
jgi:predicted homoserine dehydrogenase-like protein